MLKNNIIPVIHVIDQKQVEDNLKTINEVGLDKCFLINHQRNWFHLSEIYTNLKLNESGFYFNLNVGINFLDLNLDASIIKLKQHNINPSMIWEDNFLNCEKPRKSLDYKGLYFGGVAFKYQKQPKENELENVCLSAMKVVDVITTSGDYTGKAASISKIEKIRNFIGNFPLAVASGISSENIDNYKHLIDYVLVASSITDNNEIINKNKLENLINKV